MTSSNLDFFELLMEDFNFLKTAQVPRNESIRISAGFQNYQLYSKNHLILFYFYKNHLA